MRNKKIILFFSVLSSIIFLIVGTLSLKNYGANWDEPIHFGRGQAILHFFLTGEKNYKSFEKNPPTRQSFYQSNGYTYEYLENNFKVGDTRIIIGAGHPVISDFLAAISNRIIFGQLGLLGDIEAYHFYSVALSAILVGCVVFFTYTFYGFFAAVIAGLSLLLYPLFLGESRFNIKDPPEVVYYSLTAIAFYLGITRNNWKWIFAASISAGLAFGTKLNIVFLFVSIILWLTFYWGIMIKSSSPKKFIQKHKKVIIILILFPLIPVILYFASWPILWEDPVNRFLYNISFYRKVGLAVTSSHHFSLFGINIYAPQWILFTTPIVTLVLSFVGILWTLLFGFKEKYKTGLFVLLWFAVPILRVMSPGTEIYGGARQIMEYIPPMAILVGIGATYATQLLHRFMVSHLKKLKLFKKQKSSLMLSFQIVVIFLFIPITLHMIELHPNESVYFNSLIGGLKGASERDFPGWGNSLGSTYRQGVNWINEHTEKNAKLVFVYELGSNISTAALRSDIELNNQLRSGLERRGEYIIGVTHYGTYESSFHRKYLERFLIPVYEVRVDDVSVLKVWKNDLTHTKLIYRKDQVKYENISVSKKQRQVVIDLKKPIRLTKIEIRFDQANCTVPTNGYFEYSILGKEWIRLPGDFLVFPLSAYTRTQPKPGILQFWFAGEKARFVQLVINDKNSCLLINPIRVETFQI